MESRSKQTAEGNEVSKRALIIACIPAYNEEKTIARVIVEAQRHVDKVIVCDDGSRDLTGEIAKRLGAKVIRHERNMGYGAALASLFKAARELDASAMVILDADLQHNPSDIPKLLSPVVKGEADIVIGSRFFEKEGGVPKYRVLGIKLITNFTKSVSYKDITDAQSGFRAYSRRAIHSITPAEQGMGASIEILLKAKEVGLRVVEVPIRISYDVEKPSTHNPLLHGLDVILSTVKHLSTRRPLVFYGVPGFAALVVALFFWVWTLQIFASTKQIVTNIALIALGATLVGLMLLTTAVILWVLISVVREAKYGA
jgi:glycosyltransferase involved in cell wall biosynthesis